MTILPREAGEGDHREAMVEGAYKRPRPEGLQSRQTPPTIPWSRRVTLLLRLYRVLIPVLATDFRAESRPLSPSPNPAV